MRHRLDHPEDVEGCFGCKVLGLQLSPGDASSQKMVSNKKWDGELEAYRAARADGIQPAGTSMKKIQEARRASDVMGILLVDLLMMCAPFWRRGLLPRLA